MNRGGVFAEDCWELSLRRRLCGKRLLSFAAGGHTVPLLLEECMGIGIWRPNKKDSKVWGLSHGIGPEEVLFWRLPGC